MKKLTTILMILVFAVIFAFKPINVIEYPCNLPTEFIEFLEGEFLKEMADEDLKEDFESKFTFLFDEINSISANHSKEFGYYYVVLGQKGGIEKIELFEVLEKDIINGSYPYAGISSPPGVWKRGNNLGGYWCPSGCNWYLYQYTCLGWFCIPPF